MVNVPPLRHRAVHNFIDDSMDVTYRFIVPKFAMSLAVWLSVIWPHPYPATTEGDRHTARKYFIEAQRQPPTIARISAFSASAFACLFGGSTKLRGSAASR